MTDDTTPKDDDAAEAAADEAVAAGDAPTTDAAAADEAAAEEAPRDREPDATDELLEQAPVAADADNVAKTAKAKAKTAAKKESVKTETAKATDGAAETPEERAAKTATAERVARTRGEADARPVRAVAKYLRFSAQKGRLVVDQVRGKLVYDAATTLMFSNRAAAKEILKVLKSAVANAENNHGLSADELYVSAAFVDEGPTFKRWKPRARGRVDKVNKRTCHVTVVVSTAPEALLEGPRAARKAAKAGRGGAAKGGSSSRSARVAASKKNQKAEA